MAWALLDKIGGNSSNIFLSKPLLAYTMEPGATLDNIAHNHSAPRGGDKDYPRVGTTLSELLNGTWYNTW